MNDYIITYTEKNGMSSTAYITERTESAARKSFNTIHKGMGLSIQTVELHRENTCATKQQERDTLAAIKKMVEELGPQSYVATAFEGCFEDAASNIENDFSDSYKRRCKSLEEKLDKSMTDAQSQIKDLEAELLATRYRTEELIQKDDERKAALEQIRSKILNSADLADVIQLVSEKWIALDTEVKNAAERIVESATESESAAFKNAVKDHRAAKEDFEHYTDLMNRLIKMQKAS